MCSGSYGPPAEKPKPVSHHVCKVHPLTTRQIAIYDHQEGDPVRLRIGLGQLNDLIMRPIISMIGREGLTVTGRGNQDHLLVENEQGLDCYVPRVWLIPSDVTDEQDASPPPRRSIFAELFRNLGKRNRAAEY